MNTRTNEIKVRLNRSELELLNKRVKKSRLSREAYIRHLINGYLPRNAPPPDYYSMMRELYHIGVNLNQLAQKAHALNMIDVQKYDMYVSLFQTAVKDITKAVIEPEPIGNAWR